MSTRRPPCDVGYNITMIKPQFHIFSADHPRRVARLIRKAARDQARQDRRAALDRKKIER